MAHRSLLLVVLLALPARAADWPQWRGPNRDGHAAADGLPKAWPRQLTRLWKVEVGEGHSGPVVVGDAVYVFARQGEDEVLRGLDLATGKERWSAKEPVAYEMNPAAVGHGKGPKATPCVAGDKVYTLGITGILTCRTTAGAAVWRKAFDREFKATSPLYGTATSPVVTDGLCAAWVGGHDSGALVALDAATGDERWRLAEDGPGYSSPVVAELGGVRQLVTQSQNYLLGVDLKTGRRLWRTAFTTGYDQNSVTPLVVNDLVVTSGYERPVAAVRVGKAGGGFAAAPAWEAKRHEFYMSSPVAVGGRVFGLSRRAGGTVVCLDAATGRQVWASDGRAGEYAAFVAAGDHLLIQATDGRLAVLRADAAGYDPAAEYKVADGPTWAHPAVAGDRVIVKDKTHLYCWQVR